MNRNIVLGAIFSILLFSCNSRKPIVHAEDYSQYMKINIVADQAEKVEDEIKFWSNRLSRDTGNFVDMLEMASNYLQLFKLRGDISALHTGDSLLKRSTNQLRNSKPEILYSVSQMAITKHEFLQADSLIKKAKIAEGDLFTIALLEFDINMELGKYKEAYQNLEQLQDKSAFDYLIRKAKWEDHQGNLDNAIHLMETAFSKVKDQNKSLYVWTLSNLGDMYGHAGRIADSYTAYLQVLKKDPSNLYCLKGIAWIAFSHDRNNTEAKRIINYILSATNMPDLKLLLAQIAEIEGNEIEKKKQLNEFVATVTSRGYGNMYNKYLIEIYAEELNEHDKAFAIASIELNNRFTPETCDWMAWTYYNQGDYTKAMEFSASYVYKHTFEPVATMHTAFIFAANGKNEEAKKLLNDCLESSFELGVIATKQIKDKLQTL